MALGDDLKTEVATIFKDQWTERDGQKVPETDDLKLGNDAVKLEGVVLYADLSESTKLVDTKKPWFAAEVYKAYLHCAAKVIRSLDGTITAYDGDRIMAVFIGGSKNSSAAKAALQINYARLNIINPAIKAQYSDANYEVKHTIGIDRSDLFIARTGIRGSNDLVWVGKAANHAAKLGELPNTHPTRITKEIYDCLSDESKYADPQNKQRNMWEEVTWNATGRTIYRSTFYWPV